MAGKKAFGAKLGTYASSTLTPIANITKITPFTVKGDIVDTSSHDSPVDSNSVGWKEKEATLADAGMAKMDLNYDPALSSHVALMSKVNVSQVFKVTMPPSTPAVVWTFTGFITEVGPELPYDNKMTCSVVITITGIPTVGTT